MIACMSLDGYIARPGERPDQEANGGWTSAEDKREFHRELDAADLVVAGRKTLDEMPRLSKPAALVTRRPHDPALSDTEVLCTLNPYPSDLQDFIAESRNKRLLVCGGSMTYDLFLRWNLVDHLILVIEPILLGHGVPLRTKPKFQGGMDTCRFSLVNCRALNSRGTLKLELGRVKP